MVRSYVTSVIMDVVNRYDDAGVHFDDYFYSYPPNQITAEDNATFSNYSRGFTNGGGQDYDKLMPCWASQINGRHLYPGQAAYLKRKC